MTKRMTSPADVQRRLTLSHRRNRIRVKPPAPAGLLALRHRLAADLAASNLARINAIHAASLPRPASPDRQSAA